MLVVGDPEGEVEDIVSEDVGDMLAIQENEEGWILKRSGEGGRFAAEDELQRHLGCGDLDIVEWGRKKGLGF